MPLSINDVVQVTFKSDYQNNVILLVHHWRVGTPPGTGTVAENLDEICANFASDAAGTPMKVYKDCLGDNVTINTVRAQRVSAVRSPYVQRAVTIAGAAGSNATAPNIACVVTRNTLLTGQSQISNSHIGPMGAARYADGKVTLAQLALMSAFGVRFRQNVILTPSGAILQPGIYHPANAPGLDFSVVVGERLQDSVRTMHRRTLGLGI